MATNAAGGTKRDWNWRGLTSFIVLLSFLLLAVTGVMMYIAPQGRVANWTGWALWGLTKDQWAAVHTNTSLLFLIAAGFHIYFNWRLLVRYITLKRQLNLKRELVAATVVVALFFIGAAVSLPPFGSIMFLGEGIKAHWEAQNTQAPYPHAELSVLTEFSDQAKIPLSELLDRLAQAGIKVADPGTQTLGGLAAEHGMSPNELFSSLNVAGGQSSSGSGLGRNSVASFCHAEGLSLDVALALLSRQGFRADAQTTLKALAAQQNTTPVKVAELLRNAQLSDTAQSSKE